MQKKIIFLASSKGGVGKTLTAKALTEFLRSQVKADGSPLSVAVYDTDPNVGQLARAYGIKDANGAYAPKANQVRPEAGVALFDAREDGDKVADTMDSAADIILMDLPGGLIDMSHVYGDMEKFKAQHKKEGYQIVVMNVLSQLLVSALGMGKLMDIWGEGPRYIAVKNLGFGASDDFFYFDGPDAGKAGNLADRVMASGGAVIELPPLDGGTIGKLDEWSIPLGEAAARLSESRGEVSGWRRRLLNLESFIAGSAAAFGSLKLLD